MMRFIREFVAAWKRAKAERAAFHAWHEERVRQRIWQLAYDQTARMQQAQRGGEMRQSITANEFVAEMRARERKGMN